MNKKSIINRWMMGVCGLNHERQLPQTRIELFFAYLYTFFITVVFSTPYLCTLCWLTLIEKTFKVNITNNEYCDLRLENHQTMAYIFISFIVGLFGAAIIHAIFIGMNPDFAIRMMTLCLFWVILNILSLSIIIIPLLLVMITMWCIVNFFITINSKLKVKKIDVNSIFGKIISFFTKPINWK